MQPLYGNLASRVSLLVFGLLALIGAPLLLGQAPPAPPVPPVTVPITPRPAGDQFWSPSIRAALIKELANQPVYDPDIGQLLDPVILDEESRNSLAVLEKSFSELIFGSILSTAVVPGRLPVLKRLVTKINATLKAPVRMTIGAKVVKDLGVRGFVVKLRADDKVLVGEVYLRKQRDTWLFEDIQRLSFRTFGKAGDFSIEHRTELELEGWIPYGN